MLHTMVGYDGRYLDQMHPFDSVKEKVATTPIKWARKTLFKIIEMREKDYFNRRETVNSTLNTMGQLGIYSQRTG